MSKDTLPTIWTDVQQIPKTHCIYEKSLCKDLGEETCKEGGSHEDRSCRCNYTDGYRSIESLQTMTNKSCYRPQIEANGCAYFTCPENEELNPCKSY